MSKKKDNKYWYFTKADHAWQTVIYVFVIALSLTSLFPLIYVVGQSFASEQEFYRRGATMVIPYEPTLHAYQQILRDSNTYVRAFGVSVARTLLGTGLTIFFTMTLGYVLSRRELPGKRLIMFCLMVAILYPGGTIPSFLVVKDMGLLDSFWCMIIPGLVDCWSVLVFRQFFENLPQEVEEAAYVEGCGEVRLMYVIVIPLSKAVLAALSLFCAVGHWNSWFDALIYLQSEKGLYPLMLLLRNLAANVNLGFDASGSLNQLVGQKVTSNATSLRMAVTVLGVLPILCVYPFLQKYFVKGVYVGAVKG